jgi:hypothetical protein
VRARERELEIERVRKLERGSGHELEREREIVRKLEVKSERARERERVSES